MTEKLKAALEELFTAYRSPLQNKLSAEWNINTIAKPDEIDVIDLKEFVAKTNIQRKSFYEMRLLGAIKHFVDVYTEEATAFAVTETDDD